MKKLLIFAFITASTFGSRADITVNYDAGYNLRNVVDASAAPVADGNSVRIGFFDTGFDVAANARDLQALSGAWNEFSATTVRSIFGQPGRFADQASSASSLFDGQKIFLLVFDTSDNQAPDLSYGNVDQYGLFSSSRENWFFPSQSSDFLSRTITVTSAEVDVRYFGSFDNNSLILEAVPEPAASALLLLGGVVLFTSRRKNRPSA